jgi:hypothetical protein
MAERMTEEQFQVFLDGALRRLTKAPPVDAAAVDRVLARLARLPGQKRPLWRLPGVLLDWQFSLAWPRVAALAGCAMLGFVIGISGLDRHFDQSGAPFVVANDDLGSIIFEPEPLTGAQP